MDGLRYTGGAWLKGRLYTWGQQLREWNATATESRALASGPFRFGYPFQDDLVLEKDGILRWREAIIDTSTAVVDACEAQLFGRRGLLVVHRGMQVRFYEPPQKTANRWPYREIYSFYTASEQGGLLLHDVDGDGRPDILCGNYWIQAPQEFDLPWRLYAINLFHEHPLAASARLAWVEKRLLWIESKRPNARIRWFTPPLDPRQLWTEQPVDIQLDYPRALLIRNGQIWIGHSSGVTELSTGRAVYRGQAIHTLIPTPNAIVALGANEMIRL